LDKPDFGRLFGETFDMITDQSVGAVPFIKPDPLKYKTTNFKNTPYDPAIKRASQIHNVDEELIKGIIDTESGWNQNARSVAGAQGLMQLRPVGVKELKRQGLKVNPKNPEQNIEGGTKLIADLIQRFGNTEDALAAYNAGPTAFRNANKNVMLMPKETREYAPKVLKAARGIE